MILFVLKGLALYIGSWICWRFLTLLVVKSPLDNIPGPPSDSWWKGNLTQVFDSQGWDFHRHIYETYGGVIRLTALFGTKQLLVSDPTALHHILVKDQNIYEETSLFIQSNRLIFGMGLFGTLGEHHRKQRKMLNPVFNINHMRDMMPIFNKITITLRDTLSSKVAKGPQEIDILQWTTRTALELIGQSGLGYSFDPLIDDTDNHPYSKSIKNLMPALFSMRIVRTALPFLVKLGPPKFRAFVVRMVPSKRVQRVREMVEIMAQTSTEVFEAKKRALQAGGHAFVEQIGHGKDIMSILLKANMEAAEEDKLQDSELLGQMSTIMFAAIDTTSTAICRILHLLALHPEIQDKLRKEIQDVYANQTDIGHDTLVSIPYLDAVCRETLRLYPPASMTLRTARKNVILPLSKPIVGVDGKKITEIPIPNNTTIIVSMMASNRNPEIWGPDSYEWKPERWMSPLPDTVANAHIPGVYSHLTFIGGGRACIGFKFSQLEMKAVLSRLLQTFKFEPSEEEVYWNMTGIATPTVGCGADRRLKMPLKVSLLMT